MDRDLDLIEVVAEGKRDRSGPLGNSAKMLEKLAIRPEEAESLVVEETVGYQSGVGEPPYGFDWERGLQVYRLLIRPKRPRRVYLIKPDDATLP